MSLFISDSYLHWQSLVLKCRAKPKISVNWWWFTRAPIYRGGVLENVLGLEDVLKDTFWSPWPRSLKSSKIALSSARGQHYFLNRWNFVGKRQKPRGKFAETFFLFSQVEIAWKTFLKTFFAWKIVLKTFFLRSPEKNFEDLLFWRTLVPVSLVLGLERVCAWPWPRIFLCPWPWPRALCPRLHLCQFTPTIVGYYCLLNRGFQQVQQQKTTKLYSTVLQHL